MQYPLMPLAVPRPRVDATTVGYVPALQSKKGELRALTESPESVWRLMTPLLMVIGPKGSEDRPTADRLRAWARRVADAVGQHQYFLDTLRFNTQQRVDYRKGSKSALAMLFHYAEHYETRYIPVLDAKKSRNGRYIDTIVDAAVTNENGCAIKYDLKNSAPLPPRNHQQALEDLARKLDFPPSDIDILLDFKYISPDERLDIEGLLLDVAPILAGNWRSCTVIGTGVPAAMYTVPEGSVGTVPRPELDLWKQLRKKRGPAPLMFGDYGVQHPLPPPSDARGMRANVRYTTKDEILVSRGRGPYTDVGSSQFVELCRRLVNNSAFRGSGYSWGDGAIFDCAKGFVPPESPGFWRGAATSHHLQLVAEQLRTFVNSADSLEPA